MPSDNRPSCCISMIFIVYYCVVWCMVGLIFRIFFQTLRFEELCGQTISGFRGFKYVMILIWHVSVPVGQLREERSGGARGRQRVCLAWCLYQLSQMFTLSSVLSSKFLLMFLPFLSPSPSTLFFSVQKGFSLNSSYLSFFIIIHPHQLKREMGVVMIVSSTTHVFPSLS